MNVKPFLRNVRKLNLEIKAKKRQREGLYSLVTGSAIRYDLDRVQSSPTGDKIDRVLSEVADLDKMITGKIKELANTQKQATIMIESLDKAEYRAIMTDYYINCYAWDDVADMNGYSTSHIKKMHGYALQELKDKYDTK